MKFARDSDELYETNRIKTIINVLISYKKVLTQHFLRKNVLMSKIIILS